MKLQNVADSITDFMGTWKFVSFFCLFLVVWIAFNVSSLAFDVYPFILLNLFLSCFAAITMPIIMISQRKQEVIQKQQEAVQEQQTKTLLHLAQATQEQLKIIITKESCQCLQNGK